MAICGECITLDNLEELIDADIDAPEAWNIATGSSDIIIGVIDTGDRLHSSRPCPKHVDKSLGRFQWSNRGIDDDGNGYVDDIHGWNAIDQ